MKKNLVRVLIAILAGALLVTGCASPKTDPNPTEEPTPEQVKLGLHVESDGTITLNGSPYYGFGTNWHGVFQRFLGNTNIDLTKYFEALRDGIPYFRFMCGEFYSSGVWRYVYDKDAYFYAMDALVATAEKYHIGLIPSLMWNYSVFYEYYGEKPADALGDPEAKGTKLMIQYVTDVVTRYKDSPAIWAWEYGNEGNLSADRGNGSSIQLGNQYRLFAETVRKIDDYRMILTGDSSIFECSHALRTTGKWEPIDTPEQRIETLKILNPDPVNCIETHIYGHADTYQRVELVATDMEIAKSLGKGLFVGEYGPGYSEWDRLKGDDMVANWNDIVDIMLADGVQMAAQWGFGRYAEQADGTSIELGFENNVYQNEFQYERLKKVNEDFIAQGKSTAPEYWEKTTPLLYGTDAWKLDGSVYTNSKNDADLLKNVDITATGLWDGDSKTIEGTAKANKCVVATELADGTIGKAFKYSVVGDSGRASFQNRFLLTDAAKEADISLTKGGTYTLKIKAKLTFGAGETSFNDGSTCRIKASSSDNYIDMTGDGQWHDYTYVFTTPTSLAKCKVLIGAILSTVNAPVGTELIISNVELYEGSVS